MVSGRSKPTQKTIAQIAGLAVTTVSRALQGDPKIALATRELVAKVAADIGYVPDRAAQRLRTGKSRNISLILNPHDEILGFGNSLISGLSEAMQGSDHHLNITPCFGDESELDAIARVVDNRLADGIVLTRTRNFDERVRFLMEKGFPFICHGRTDFTQKHNFVDFDNEDFAYKAALRLAEKGARRLAIILPRDSFTFHQHMRYGFMKAVRETGIDYVVPDNLWLDSSAEDIHSWAVSEFGQKGSLPVDGFVCPGEASYLALFAALRELGLTRGKEFDAIVKSNSDILKQIDPKIDLIAEDIREAGALMGKCLLGQLKGEQDEIQQIVQAPKATF